MKKFLAMILTLMLALTTVFGLSACDSDEKYITVGITNAAPMNYQDASGNWIGFDTDLTITIFTELGYKVMFKEIQWENKYIELESGTIDCIWNGFTANSSDEINGVKKERSTLVNFSKNYMINEQCVIKNKSVDFDDEKSFNEKTIAYEKGSSGETGVNYIEEDYPTLNFYRKESTSQSKAMQEVNSGTADFAVIDRSLAENAASSGYNNVVIVNWDYFNLEYYAIGFKKDAVGAELRNKVNALLDKYYENGYMQSLCTKYKIEYERVTAAFGD